MTIMKKKEQHKMKQITNREVKTDPVVDANPEIKHDPAVLDLRVREERPVKMEEGREESLLRSRYGGREE